MKPHFIPLPPRLESGVETAAVAAFSGNSLWLRESEGRFRLPMRPDFAPDAGHTLVVGRIGGLAYGALELPGHTAAGTELKPFELRDALLLLSEAERIAAGRGRELLFWRRRRKHCGVCGASLTAAERDCSLVCPACGAAFFPSLAPAVIVAISRGRELLLAHNRKFRDGLYSLIAGFVDPGENLEQAVEREIREEVGIEVADIRYFGSQSWPFPNSLMLGFTAEYLSGEIRPDGGEIIDAHWYLPGQLPDIPSHGSISRQLIDAHVAVHS